MSRWWAFTVVFWWAASATIKAQTDSLPEAPPPRWQGQGYLKDLQSLAFAPAQGSLSTGNFLHHRLNFRYTFSPAFSARLECRTRLFWGEQVRLTPDFVRQVEAESGYLDLSWTPIHAPALVGHTIVDRLSLNWQHRRWDLTLGRQRINWGLSTAWNPNDLFNAFNFFDFDYEERPGSDALRVRYNLGGMAGFDLAVSQGEGSGSTVAALLYRFNRGGYDAQALGAWYRDELALGGGWAGSLGEVGFKGEATWFQPRRHFADTTGVLAFTVEGNYTLEGGWYLSGALLYTGSGGGQAAALDGLAGQTLSARMLMPFKYSLLVQGAKQITPLFTAQLSLVYCPGPAAVVVFPVLSYSLSPEWDLNFVAQSFFIAAEKKFRNRSTALIMRLKWSF